MTADSPPGPQQEVPPAHVAGCVAGAEVVHAQLRHAQDIRRLTASLPLQDASDKAAEGAEEEIARVWAHHAEVRLAHLHMFSQQVYQRLSHLTRSSAWLC